MNKLLDGKDYVKLAGLNHNWYDAISSDFLYIYKNYFEQDKKKNQKFVGLSKMVLKSRN